MKIIRIMLIIVLFSTSSYAFDWGGALQGVGQGMSQGIEDAQRMEEIRMRKEQRQAQEEQRQRNNELKDNYNKVANYLDYAVPDWRKIDVDPNFTEWLKANNKMQTLHTAVDDGRRWDVAQFFNDYKATLQAQALPPTPTTMLSKDDSFKITLPAGWYLMSAPWKKSKESKPNLSYPLKQWNQEGSFDSASACEAARVRELAELAVFFVLAHMKSNETTYKFYELSEATEQWLLSGDSSKIPPKLVSPIAKAVLNFKPGYLCIATNDPRLN